MPIYYTLAKLPVIPVDPIKEKVGQPGHYEPDDASSEWDGNQIHIDYDPGETYRLKYAWLSDEDDTLFTAVVEEDYNFVFPSSSSSSSSSSDVVGTWYCLENRDYFTTDCTGTYTITGTFCAEHGAVLCDTSCPVGLSCETVILGGPFLTEADCYGVCP
ncbi:MAG: hypothetical protein GF411_01775 [Candidatus Lokiarchaeota archaeon]|nr:hypothetical protein [Candidatus Lokiarchaeota archaeon]